MRRLRKTGYTGYTGLLDNFDNQKLTPTEQIKAFLAKKSAVLPHPPTPDEKCERSAPEQLSDEQLTEARRIAGESVKLHAVGAISGPDDPESVFFAHLLHTFGATFDRRCAPSIVDSTAEK